MAFSVKLCERNGRITQKGLPLDWLSLSGDGWGGLLTWAPFGSRSERRALCGPCEALGCIELLRKAFQLLAFFLMHFVCCLYHRGTVWLLLKYYLHGFAEGEKPTVQDLSREKSHSVAVFGVCGSVLPSRRTDRWLHHLDTPVGLNKTH